jgi:hypothetical protein
MSQPTIAAAVGTRPSTLWSVSHAFVASLGFACVFAGPREHAVPVAPDVRVGLGRREIDEVGSVRPGEHVRQPRVEVEARRPSPTTACRRGGGRRRRSRNSPRDSRTGARDDGGAQQRQRECPHERASLTASPPQRREKRERRPESVQSANCRTISGARVDAEPERGSAAVAAAHEQAGRQIEAERRDEQVGRLGVVTSTVRINTESDVSRYAAGRSTAAPARAAARARRRAAPCRPQQARSGVRELVRARRARPPADPGHAPRAVIERRRVVLGRLVSCGSRSWSMRKPPYSRCETASQPAGGIRGGVPEGDEPGECD